MMLSDIKSALLTVLPTKTYHHISPTGTVAPYIVWAEDGQADALHGDGKMINQVLEGTIDLFCKVEYDPLFARVQAALNAAGIGFRLNSIQYERDTRLFHYEWVWNIETDVS